jgi:PIN domain nuclease of toxin-antitoxin system
VDGDALAAGFGETGVEIAPFDTQDARLAGELALVTHTAGLSLGDRSCLGLAQRLSVPAVTADKAWLEVECGVEVICIR